MSGATLPDPKTEGSKSVERAIADRASRRTFGESPMTKSDISQVLWSAQGITHRRDGIEMRAAPSAGATYPVEVFIVIAAKGAEHLSPGLYQYVPDDHQLIAVEEGTFQADLTAACYGQQVISQAHVAVILAAVYDRTVQEYPTHGRRYVHLEVGHIAENVHLICESRDLHCCPVGAFEDDAIGRALPFSDELDPVYLLAMGTAPSRSQ